MYNNAHEAKTQKHGKTAARLGAVAPQTTISFHTEVDTEKQQQSQNLKFTGQENPPAHNTPVLQTRIPFVQGKGNIKRLSHLPLLGMN